MATEKFTAATSRGTILTTELNSLANGDTSAAGTELDNATNKDRWAMAVLAVTFGTNPTARACLQLYGIVTLDGTNYEQGGAVTSGSGTPPPESALLAAFQVVASTSAQRIVSGMFRLRGPYKHKFLLKNRSGQALPSSGTTVTLYTFNRDIS